MGRPGAASFDARRERGIRPVSAAAREAVIREIAFHPIRETDLDEVLSIERSALFRGCPGGPGAEIAAIARMLSELAGIAGASMLPEPIMTTVQ